MKAKVRATAAVSCATAAALCEAFVAPTSLRRSVNYARRLGFIGRSLDAGRRGQKNRPEGLRMIYAPPGSGYVERDEETNFYPETYDPMMEYPGTMRPGRTPENQAYENLPCGDDDPDPVPWPHLQEIEWHHLWEPPHPHFGTMEDFIEKEGRWASVEDEAQMRMDVRRGVRERRELEELEKAGVTTLIVDTDEDDEEEGEGPRMELGAGVQDLFGATEEEVATDEDKAEEKEEEEEEGDGDFLLDLGLDSNNGGDDEGSSDEDVAVDDEDSGDEPAFSMGGQGAEGILEAMQGLIDMETEDEGDVDASSGGEDDDDEIDLDIDLGLLDDDDTGASSETDEGANEDEGDVGDTGITMIGDDGDFGGDSTSSDDGGFQTIPLDDYSDSEDMGDEEGFDDGGFDYDGGDDGGSDMW